MNHLSQAHLSETLRAANVSKISHLFQNAAPKVTYGTNDHLMFTQSHVNLKACMS